MTSAAPPLAPEPRAAGPRAADLMADLHRLPAQRPALMRIVQTADDPACSLKELADAVATDPALTARVLQIANSAYYGRAGRVTAIVPAVSLMGGQTLRGLAVGMALGLAGENGPLPPGFWDRAAVTATGSQLVAPHVGAEAGDAFCVGLLREVGQALLYRAAPHAYGALLRGCTPAELGPAERAWCGTTNAELASAALTAGGLPDSVCAAIARHQHDDEHGTLPEEPLARALRGGTVLAAAVTTGEVDDAVVDVLQALTDGVLEPQDVTGLALQTAAQAAALSAAMH